MADAQAVLDAVSCLPETDVLVNNAGICHYGLISQITQAQWDRLFAVNVGGIYHCVNAVLPAMLHRQSGCILNVSSMWGQVGASCEACYSATKGAVLALTKALAQELGPSGIRVNCVSPGVILTDMVANVAPEVLAELAQEAPLGKNGTPEDVAQAMVYLAGAGFVTGQNLPVNGTGWIQLLKPENFSPIIAFIGVVLIMMCKKPRKRDIGKILVGFAVLMYGMTLMGSSVSGLEDSAAFTSILTAFENPLLGVLVGAVVTGVIQSSAASVGILQTLAATGQISYGVAIPIIMGQNIGTCVTALISSIGVNKNARKVAVVHITFNLIGTVVCLCLFYGLHAIFHFAFVATPINAVGISAVHTIFNLFTTALLCPFTKQLERFANFVIRPSKKKETYAFLDERLLGTPSIAVGEASDMTVKMATLARMTILSAINICQSYDVKVADEILKHEDELDLYEDKLGTFLVKLSSRSLSIADSRKVSNMLHTIGDFERLGDHAVNLRKTAEEIHDKHIVFSEDAVKELQNLTNALTEILELTIDAFSEHNLEMARHVEPLEQVIDCLISAAKSTHVERLQSGKCTIQNGFVLNDLLTNYERVSDHCSNIAVSLIETSAGSFDTHEYLSEVKEGGSKDYTDLYHAYTKKYALQ